jgi:hypothetical protein
VLLETLGRPVFKLNCCRVWGNVGVGVVWWGLVS